MGSVGKESFVATTKPHEEDLGAELAMGDITRQRLRRKTGFVASYLKWALRVPEPKGPLDLEQFAFQKPLYSQEGAMHPEIAIKKACLAPETRVLRADLTWVPIGTIRPGDELVAVDEEPLVGENGRRYPRRMRTALVEGVRRTTADTTFRLTLTGGTTITASGNHPLLWRRGCRRGEPGWKRVDEMQVGDGLRWIVDPWDQPDYEDGWMAGLLDGEGSFRRRPIGGVETVLSQRHGEVYDRARDYLDRHGIRYREELKRGGYEGSGEVGRLVMNRTSDTLRLLGRCQATRWAGQRWWNGLGMPKGNADANAWRRIEKIEPLGPSDEVVDLQTSEATYIAEGIVSHNTQVGVSTWLLRWVLFLCDAQGLNALYLFPKRQQMYDFADARIKTAIEGSPYLMKRIPAKHVNNKGLKRIGTGHLYARGSESKDDLQSVDADALAMDEYDDLRQENVPDAERRLSGSREPRIRRVGVPSLPNYGISRIYDESDQRRWVVQCGRCGLRQPLSYDDNVDEERKIVVCRGWKGDVREGLSCREPLDVRVGEWVATYPDRDKIGYHMPRLIVAHTNIANIVAAHQKTNPIEKTIHYNKDLAEAFAPEEGRLSDEAIDAATRPELPPDSGEPYDPANLVTMGVDTAGRRNLHVRISEHKNENLKVPLFVDEVESFAKVKELMVRFKVNMAVIDHLPETRLAMQVADEFPGRVFLAHFATLKSGVLDVREELREVAVHRVALLDMTFDRIRHQRTLLPNSDQVHADYKDHLQGLYRMTGVDPKGNKLARYEHTGDFDFAMAEAYDQLAAICWEWRQGVTEGIEGQTTPFEEVYELDREHLDAFDPEAGDEYGGGFE